jgi:23S rRNA (guanosine2251-2'-O)-methyltransferase
VAGRSPRDRYLTVYGRMPVLEALASPTLAVARVFVAESATGEAVARILDAAGGRQVPVERVSTERVAALARNGRHHQGVAADVDAPNLCPLGTFLERRSHGRAHRSSVLVLDAVHNPSNVGMVLRSATAAGLDGVVVPRHGTAELGPLVVKASAGVAFHAPVIRCDTTVEAVDALLGARFELVGLDATAPGAADLFGAELPERAAYVVGNEAAGLSPEVRERVGRWLRVPLAGGVESLNVAAAATLVAFEVARREGRLS